MQAITRELQSHFGPRLQNNKNNTKSLASWIAGLIRDASHKFFDQLDVLFVFLIAKKSRLTSLVYRKV